MLKKGGPHGVNGIPSLNSGKVNGIPECPTILSRQGPLFARNLIAPP